MPRFFTTQISEKKGVITGEDAKHIIKSLRMKIGEEIVLCDTQGTDYYGKIHMITQTQVEVEIEKITPTFSEPNLQTHLFQALPKGDKMDTIVQKAVELGVNQVTPVLTQFCVSRPDEKSLGKKIARWQKVATEAAKQSGRGIVPKINACMDLNGYLNFIKTNKDGTHLFAYEKGGVPLSCVNIAGAERVTILVGSEGGFSEAEAQNIIEAGAVTVTLGKRILRCETAPVALLSVLMFQSGNLE